MILDVDKCVKDYTDRLTDLNEEQKKNFAEMATAMGNFLNCLWAQSDCACENGRKSDTE